MTNLIGRTGYKGTGPVTQSYMQHVGIQSRTDRLQVAVQVQVGYRQQRRRRGGLAPDRRRKRFACLAIQTYSNLILLIQADRNVQVSVFVKIAERQPFRVRYCSSGEFVGVQIQRPVTIAGEDLKALAETIDAYDIQNAVTVDVA